MTLQRSITRFERRELPLIVALYGGPGTGKSTTASLVFGALKQQGYNVELVHEVAKDMTWEGRTMALGHQPYMMAKQMFRYDRLNGQVDAIITDTSTLLGLIYLRGMPASVEHHFVNWIMEDWRARRTLNVMLQRDPSRPYNPKGRSQTEQEAQALDARIEALLTTVNVPVMTERVDKDSNSHVDEIVAEVVRQIA